MAKQSRLVTNKKTGAVHENKNMKKKPKSLKPTNGAPGKSKKK